MATQKEITLKEQDDGSAVVEGFDDDKSDTLARRDHDDDDDHHEGDEHDRHEGDEHDGDTETKGAKTADPADGDDRERIREARRQERKDRNRQRREREASLRRENEELRRQMASLGQQVEVIARRTAGGELAQFDAAIQKGEEALTYYRALINDATKNQDGATVADATLKIARVDRELENLRRGRMTHAQQVNRAVEQHAPAASAQPDPRMVANAQDWMKRNPWYDPQLRDTDSRIVYALDQQLTAEGYDPKSADYWEELDHLVQTRLPQRVKSSGDRRATRSPTTGNGADSSPSTRGGSSYTLSPDRVKALKEAGMWENPAVRADAIKRFRDYDRQKSKR